jgi:transposase
MGMENTNQFTDGITAGVEERKQRGLQIAALCRIEKNGRRWLVPSQSSPNRYQVWMTGAETHCNCPDHEERGCKCKHIYAVEYYIVRERHADGSVTESFTIKQTRKTYPQNWPAYNEAQTTEKARFQALLADLCRDIKTPEQVGRGQRRMPLSDAVFAAVFKIYSTMSARRFTSDLCDAQAKGYIDKVPHFNSVLNYLESPELYPILLDLIERSSLPLRSVESQFAVDSTGFAFCRFARWYDIKYNRFTSEKQWVKAHLCCGTKTNIVTAVEIHGKDANDAPILPSLVEATAKNFDVKEVCADKGYSSVRNHNAIERLGAVPFIAFKSTAGLSKGGIWDKMFHYFQFNREDFLAHYHRRSNVESTMMMIKTKFGDSVRSKTETATRNEVLAKVLCHNICCLIAAMYELGIDPNLCTTKGVNAQQDR